MTQRFQTELEQAKEMARMELEQEHLENLKLLELSLEQKHEEQLQGLAELQDRHVKEMEALKADHVNEIEQRDAESARTHADSLVAISLDAEREVTKGKEELEFAHRKELEMYQESLESEQARVLALEAVQASLEVTHKEIVEKMKEEHEKEMNTVKNIVDAVHGDQVRELQDLLEQNHRQVRYDGIHYLSWVLGFQCGVMWGIRGWCGRGGSGKRCDGACVSEREGVNSVVNTVILWIGNVAGVWVELGKANGGKRAVVASVKGYKVDTCGVRGRERKTAGESK